MNGTLSTKLNYAIELLRVIFISVEFTLGLAITAWVLEAPALIENFGASIAAQKDVLKYLPTIPVALCAITVTLGWKLTVPKDGSNRDLLDWPEYWRLRLRRNVSIMMSVIWAGIALSCWAFCGMLTHAILGALAGWALLSSLATCGSSLFASYTLREIVED